MMAEQNLMQRFVDEGDMLLEHAFETDAGRELYDRIRNHVLAGHDQLSRVYDFYYVEALCVKDLTPTNNDARILVLKMIEKSVADLIKTYLR